MTKTHTTATAATCDHSGTTRRIQIARHGHCTRCHGTGIVLVCNDCGITGCDGNCDCTYCLGEKKIGCENDRCDQGRIVDADGDPTDTKCGDCKGKGQVVCPRC